MSTSDIALIMFCLTMAANVVALFRFWQAMRAFTRSQRELNEMLKRAGYGDASVR
jgi:hypothetical protein